MFSTWKLRLLLGVYIFILLSIPVGAFLASQNQNTKSRANETATKSAVQTTPKPTTTSAAKELLSASESNLVTLSSTSSASPSSSTEPTIATTFGPTLSLKEVIQGRPANNQSTRLFLGIIQGDLTSNPKFILNFTVNVPSSGEYSNFSLAGLNPGSKYTAIVKGSSQIATSSAFIMSPNVTNLNDGQPINMLSGDLNEDNVINAADYSIAQKALNSTSTSSNWNENADLNKDGVVNIFDLAIINSNIGKIGASGAWTSPIPKSASSSASLSGSHPIGSPEGGDQGYWIWVPHISAP